MSVNLSDLKSIFKRPKHTAVVKEPGATGYDTRTLKKNMDQIYKVEPTNWYTAKPYGFKTITREGLIYTMFLPISPSNLNISTNFATNMIPTLYGTVEEHSDVRYYDISIDGTTGMAPQFVEPGATDNAAALYSQLRKSGRSQFSAAEATAVGGFFAKTLGVFNQLKNKASDLLDGGVKPRTGINAENSGYVAFHNLYRFLLQYKKDTSGADGGAGKRTSHPLWFFNYKDNNQYNVVVKNFTLRRSADNPMLYYYSIQLRGYNLGAIKSPVNENLTQRLDDLGLNGIDSSSILGDIKSLSRQAKAVIGSALGGISVLGR